MSENFHVIKKKKKKFFFYSPLKPQLQIRAGAENSTDTREIINRYRKLGTTRSILRCCCCDADHVRIGTLTNQNIEYRG